ncbi:MAG: hypothetical protein K6L76_13575 [Agarilytica sp.]
MEVFKELSQLASKICIEICNEYKSLFKAGVFLVGVALAGLSQTYPELTSFDYKARAIQYEVEATYQKEIANINCGISDELYAKCKLAQYQISNNINLSKFAAFLTVVIAYAGLGLTVISLFGFLGAANKNA